VDWQIGENIRCDMVGFTKPSFAGTRHVVQIFPSGRQGDLPDELSSLILVGPLGTRLVLVTTRVGEYTNAAWRCIDLVKGSAFQSRDGRPAVRIPDLELLDKPDAHRTDLDFEQTFDFAADLESGKGWTFGRPGPIKERVVLIRVERVG
jgi:hypothetical protein